MDKYARVSAEIMAILADFSPLVEPVSVDEAFIDLTGTSTLWGPPPEAVRAIKARIRRETGRPASAGLAANKFIAKVASDLDKPDGLVIVEPGREAEFLAPLPIERLWGVGKATAKELQALGVGTIGQLQRIAPRALVARLGPHGPDLLALAFGRDERDVEPFSPPSPWAPRRRSGAIAASPRGWRRRCATRPSAWRASCEPRGWRRAG